MEGWRKYSKLRARLSAVLSLREAAAGAKFCVSKAGARACFIAERKIIPVREKRMDVAMRMLGKHDMVSKVFAMVVEGVAAREV